ncbi:hypothetical protein [Nocardioides alcanivorans]|uniref:hypothetical protein n=1 Tax=Nocardioides alcanivorans TaxID=2897352 RepID=UPI001F293EDE|nr:hypothetical protein [Nocardioides alcanivorans]
MTSTDTTPTAPTSDLDLGDLLNSANGYEEIAVEQRFGADPYALLGTNVIKCMRAGVFIVHRRRGAKDADAYKAAMELTSEALNAFFPDDEDEPMPEEPVTEAGKDDSESA